MSSKGTVNLYARKPLAEKRLDPDRRKTRFCIFWLSPHPLVKNCFPTLDAAVAQCERYPQYKPREIQDRITGVWYTTAGALDMPTLATAGGNE